MHYIKSLPLKTHAILALTLMVICNIFLFTYLNQLKTETCTNNNAVIVNNPTVDCRVASKSCPNLKCIKNDENQQQYSKHYLPSNLPTRLVYDDPYPDYLLKYCKEQKYLYDVNLHRTIITPPLDEFYFNEATKGTWEKNTFATFHHFVGPETTYIDFGTWNGITLLFGAAHAKRAYGLECDQVAYRKAKNNLLCNPEINLKTRLIETCVYTSHSIGLMNMRGGSDSSVEFLVGDNISMVEMRTLEMVFDDYNIKGHVFIKMDAEGAECVLIPYLYDFVNERYPKPTIFVSMHNGPRTGNKTCDWEKFLSVIQLYDNAGVWGEFWKSTDEWTIEDILKCKKKTWDIIMTNVPLEDLNRIDRN